MIRQFIEPHYRVREHWLPDPFSQNLFCDTMDLQPHILAHIKLCYNQCFVLRKKRKEMPEKPVEITCLE
jgi:hypothetical protein